MNVVFSWLLDYMEGPAILDLQMKDKSNLKIEKLILLPEHGEIYMQFQNVGKNETAQDMIETKTSAIETDVKVFKRGSFVNRLQDIKKFMSPELKQAAISHLYLRRCLRIGDAGFHNILQVDESCSLKQKIAGIDLEEFTSKSGDS